MKGIPCDAGFMPRRRHEQSATSKLMGEGVTCFIQHPMDCFIISACSKFQELGGGRGRGIGKTGNLDVEFSRQGKQREFAQKKI